MNSTITIVVFIAVIWFPIWMFKKIWKNRDDIEDTKFQKELKRLFEDLRVTNLQEALYQFYFVIRRLFLAIILTFFSDQTVLQVTSFVMISVF